jgi:mycoredoxin
MFYATSNRPYRRRSTQPDVPIVVYGTGWCAASQMVRRYLERRGLPYRYVDIERDPGAARQVRWWTGGSASHPTVYLDGEILVEPSLRELEWALARVGMR